MGARDQGRALLALAFGVSRRGESKRCWEDVGKKTAVHYCIALHCIAYLHGHIILGIKI
jgi:hypothetical protein